MGREQSSQLATLHFSSPKTFTFPSKNLWAGTGGGKTQLRNVKYIKVLVFLFLDTAYLLVWIIVVFDLNP